MDHLGIVTTKARCAILTGDPDRAKLIATALGGGMEIATRRGFHIHEAQGANCDLLVIATGIGGPSTAIVVEELSQLGIQSVIRIGTCGAIQKDIGPLELVVSTGSVRDEGTTRQYVDIAFPALPDLDLTAALIFSLHGHGCTPHVGITHSKDAYYAERAVQQLLPDVAAQRWRWLRAAGVLATEMEAASLFVVGSLRAVRTAAALITVSSVTQPHEVGAALSPLILATTEALASVSSPHPRWRSPEALTDDSSYLTPPRNEPR